MRLRFYSLKDRLTGVFLSPFVSRSDVDAYRQIKSTLVDERMRGQLLVTNSGDYDLYYVASFDDETGEVFPEAHAAGSAPCVLVNVGTLKSQIVKGDGDVVA